MFSFIIDNNFDLKVIISHNVFIVLSILLILLVVYKLFSYISRKSFEFNEAEFGIGNQKIKFKANHQDLQIAYQIWIELSTRKIGLPIDLNNDVIIEIYDSWYSFFNITRELLKDIPISKFKNRNTEKLINLSIDLLNNGLRPHLTKWQARYRKWYEFELSKNKTYISPQEIQKKYAHYKELSKDILVINNNLMNYRNRMKEIIS